MLRNSILVLAVLISGCASEPTIKVVTQRVDVPVPVPCKEEIPEEPAWCFPNLTDSDDIYTKVRCLLSDRKLSESDRINLTAKLKACK